MKYKNRPEIFQIEKYFSLFFFFSPLAIETLKKALHFFFKYYFTFW
jgi:hypothetical protein